MSRREHWIQLRAHTPVILPSLLQCDFGNLQREVERLEEAGVQALHLDVMDGHFVPNFTYGMPIVAALRKLTQLPLDVHLMISEPSRYASAFIDAGADLITFHIEAQPEPRSLLQEIRQRGLGAGLALNPATPVEDVEPFLDVCDLVLVMSVPAGFGGQSFDPVALEKLQALQSQGREGLMLEVDGGVNADTIASCAGAGASLFVVGSAIFCQPVYEPAVRQLRTLARGGVE